jgi:hypothetical protein
MPTTIQCIRGLIEENLSEGTAIFVFEYGKFTFALQAVGFLGDPTPNMDIRKMSIRGVERYLVCLDNEQHPVNSVDAMRQQIYDTLDAFRERGVRTVSMNAIKIPNFPDNGERQEAYQKRFVKEYVADNPDAFDTIRLVDKRDGFNLC